MRPRRTASAPDTLVALDAALDVPLYQQLYGGLRDAILSGRLAPGARLPSSRLLATDLRVSRNTVSLAFDQLRAEGYLEGRVRAGTFVTQTLPDGLLHARRPAADRRSSHAPAAPRISTRGARLTMHTVTSAGIAAEALRPFQTGMPALDAFPAPLWARLTMRRWRRADSKLLAYGDAAGHRPLREAIAAHAAAARGVRCTADQVIVVSGAQRALFLAASLLLDPGDCVWLEDPGYPGAQSALAGAGARLVPVPGTEEGLDVEAGEALAPAARLAYVSPSHQFPLGATMSAARRIALLRWAARADAWVLEDDYDSEFRYATRPLPSLQGLDTEDRVLYIGTFSKTLFPALRLGYLIVPPGLVDAFVMAQAVTGRHTPTMDQAVLTDFLTGGHFARHVRRVRALYAERQAALVQAAHDELEQYLEVRPSAAGMHLVGWLPVGVNDRAVSRAARDQGMIVPPLSRYALTPQRRGALLLGYAAFAPRTIRAAARRLRQVFEQIA